MRGLSESDLLLEEAEETDYDSYDSAAEDEFYNGQDSADENLYEGRTFHPFSRLPPELRIRVWELALGEEAQPRILHFGLDLSPPRLLDSDDVDDVVIDWTVRTTEELAKETRHVRRIIAVNREARDVVLKTMPHALKLRSKRPGRGPATVNFHRDRDVAYLSAGREFQKTLSFDLRGDWQQGGRCNFEGFAENVTQLAINCSSLSSIEEFDDGRLYAHILEPFSNLKRLFLELLQCEQLKLGDKIWAGSEFVYTHEVAIRDRGNGYFLTKRVWPNADDYDDFARQLPVPTFNEPGLPSTKRLRQLGHGAMILPMFVFEDRRGYETLEKLRALWQEAYSRGIPVEELSDWSLDGDDDDVDQGFGSSEPDEYESEGIDDSEIIENGTDHYDSDEDDLSGDLVHGDDESSNGDDDDSDGDSGSALNGRQNDRSVPNGNAAAFSSPEPEPTSVSGTQNSRKRRIVADSDDELPSDVSRKRRARNGGLSTGIRADTDDEGVSETSAARMRRRRAAVVDSDDEDEDDEEDGDRGKDKQEGETGKKNDAAGREDDTDEEEDDDDTSDEDDDDEDEDDVEDDDEVADVKRLSLAARLDLVPPRHRLSRNSRIVSTDDEEDDEDDEDDDEEDDEDDEDDERSEDGLIDGIAEESDMSD
ncbi:hypothetical protein V8C44DRAFT_319670 [Trichoderma aethiopicum]